MATSPASQAIAGTLPRAERAPEYARGIIYGIVILAILFTYGRNGTHD